MILIGQFDSPFVRRVGIALRFYEFDFEHRPWSTFGDADRVAAYNPLRRVPTLVLDEGEVLIESAAILDHLDDTVGPDRAMIPRSGEIRRHALQACALATGMADKAVSLVYEGVLHAEPAATWVDRCSRQIADALAELERRRSGAEGAAFWFGDRIGHADVALACVLRFLRDAHPALFDPARWPALATHLARCETLAPFGEIAQPFVPPRR